MIWAPPQTLMTRCPTVGLPFALEFIMILLALEIAPSLFLAFAGPVAMILALIILARVLCWTPWNALKIEGASCVP